MSKMTPMALMEAQRRWQRRFTIADHKLYDINREIARRMMGNPEAGRPPVEKKRGKPKAGPERDGKKITRRFSSES